MAADSGAVEMVAAVVSEAAAVVSEAGAVVAFLLAMKVPLLKS